MAPVVFRWQRKSCLGNSTFVSIHIQCVVDSYQQWLTSYVGGLLVAREAHAINEATLLCIQYTMYTDQSQECRKNCNT